MRRFHCGRVVIMVVIAQAIMPSTPIHCQAVHLCCTVEDCQRQKVQPNLLLSKRTHLFGVIGDPSGATIAKSQVELRRWISATNQVSLKVVRTDDSGGFDLGQIKAGQYRFLPSPHGGFKQPKSLSCPQAECPLKLVLQINPTDIPGSVCPIR